MEISDEFGGKHVHANMTNVNKVMESLTLVAQTLILLEQLKYVVRKTPIDKFAISECDNSQIISRCSSIFAQKYVREMFIDVCSRHKGL